MTLLDARPDVQSSGDGDWSTIMSRYRQVWLPTLYVCRAILTSLHRSNKSSSNQVVHFLVSHDDVISTILRLHPTNASSEDLQELALLTSILAYTAHTDLLFDADNVAMCTRLKRIQRQVLSLLPRWLPSESTVPELSRPMLKIMCNVLIYARCIIRDGGDQSSMIFSPFLNESHVHGK